MTTKEALTKLESLKADAAKDVDDMPANVRGAWGARKNEAIQQIPAARQAYQRKLLEQAAAIYLTGPADGVSAFSQLVLADSEAILIDASALYARLAAPLDSLFGTNRQWTTEQSRVLHVKIEEVMRELGINDLPQPTRKEDIVLRDAAALQEYVKSSIKAVVGNELNALYLKKLLTEQAEKIRYSSSVTPVLVINAQPDEQADLSTGFGKGFGAVTIGDEQPVDKEFVQSALKEVNKKIKLKNKTK